MLRRAGVEYRSPPDHGRTIRLSVSLSRSLARSLARSPSQRRPTRFYDCEIRTDGLGARPLSLSLLLESPPHWEGGGGGIRGEANPCSPPRRYRAVHPTTGSIHSTRRYIPFLLFIGKFTRRRRRERERERERYSPLASFLARRRNTEHDLTLARFRTRARARSENGLVKSGIASWAWRYHRRLNRSRRRSFASL